MPIRATDRLRPGAAEEEHAQMAAGDAAARTTHLAETPGHLAERLLPVAVDLVVRVHDESRDSIGQLLSSLSADERWALLVVLAAMVPPDVQVADLLAWVTWDEHGQPLASLGPQQSRRPLGRGLRPCGTHAAYARHKARGENPCPACTDAEREYQRGRTRTRRAA